MPMRTVEREREIRAYDFGCRVPIEGLDEAIAQQRLRVTLWNQLVEIERRRRDRMEALVQSLLPPGLPDPEKLAGKEKQAAWTVVKSARREVFARDEVKEQLAVWREESWADAKTAYRGGDLHSWTLDDVLTGYRAACGKADAPRFHRFSPRQGCLALRWQHGLPVQDAFAGTDTRLQLEVTSRRPNGRLYVDASFRIASQDRKPVWCVVETVLHRPLPEHGVIRKAWLKWSPVASKSRWQLVLVVETPGAAAPTAGTGTVALDFCWRVRPKGALRVGYWMGSDGATGELALPGEWRKESERVEALRSARDLSFNSTRKRLEEWLPERVVPEWLTEATATIGQWKSPGRLAVLILRWRENRFQDDEEMYAALEGWRRGDKRAWEEEANLRDRLLAHRQHLYREFAAELAQQYDTVAVEKIDLRKMARLDRAGGDLSPQVRSQRVEAALSELRAALANAFRTRGGTFMEVDPKYSTVDCHRCGHREEWDKAADLVHTCGNCGATWDQDRNAAQNLLQRAADPGIASSTEDICEDAV